MSLADKLAAAGIMTYSAAWAAIVGNDIIIRFTAALWSYRHALEGWM